VLGDALDDVRAQHRAAGGSCSDEHGGGPIDRSLQGIPQHGQGGDGDDGGQRRAVGKALAHSHDQDEAGDDEDASAHAEQPGKESRKDADCRGAGERGP
jgi:hypothetical protein